MIELPWKIVSGRWVPRGGFVIIGEAQLKPFSARVAEMLSA